MYYICEYCMYVRTYFNVLLLQHWWDLEYSRFPVTESTVRLERTHTCARKQVLAGPKKNCKVYWAYLSNMSKIPGKPDAILDLYADIQAVVKVFNPNDYLWHCFNFTFLYRVRHWESINQQNWILSTLSFEIKLINWENPSNRICLVKTSRNYGRASLPSSKPIHRRILRIF